MKEAEEKKDKEKPKADADEGQEGRVEGRQGRGPRHRPRRPGHPQGPAHHPLLVARRRPRQQGRRDALLPGALREEREPVVHEPADQGNEDAGGAQRQQRQHGVGQGAEEHLPAGRRHDLEDRPGRRQARERRASAARVVADTEAERAAMFDHVWRRTARHVLLRPAITASTGPASARSTRSTCRTSATTTSSPRCSARCSAS